MLPAHETRRFVGMDVPQDLIFEFIAELISMENGAKCHNNYRAKYSGQYHVTLVSSAEFASVNESVIVDIIGTEVEVAAIGLGSVSRHSNSCYFIICQSEELASLRKRLSLAPKDFHITIGFSEQDIHDVSKGFDTLMKG